MRLQLRSLVAAVALVCSLAVGPKAGAIDILTPAGLNPGDQFRFVFVSSSEVTRFSSLFSRP